MSEMVERVAREIVAWEDADDDVRAWALGKARRIIAAMREPTDEMINDAADVHDDLTRRDMREAWDGLIHAALSPHPAPDPKQE